MSEYWHCYHARYDILREKKEHHLVNSKQSGASETINTIICSMFPLINNGTVEFFSLNNVEIYEL